MNEIINETALSSYRDYNGGYFKTLIPPTATGGALALMEMVLPKGSEPPLHVHANEDETFYLLEGEMEFVIGGSRTKLKPEGSIFAERGVPHLFRILSAEARFLTVITPGKFWEFFQEFSTPTIGEPVIFPPQGPPPPEALQRLIERMTNVYQIILIGPGDEQRADVAADIQPSVDAG